MDIATKQSKWEQFKAADIGEESYASMVFFGSNILYIDRLLVLEGKFLEDFEKGKLEPQIPPDQRLKIVQVGQMDALSKIMIMIESMFVTIGAFCNDKKKLSTKLQEYTTSDVWNVVNDILSRRFSIVDYWKIMGFPKLQKLGLKPQELSLLKKMLNEVLKEFAEKIKWLAKFYERHSRLYNKFKHALSVRFGYEKRIPQIQGPQHLLIAFDFKSPKPTRRKTVIPVNRTSSVSQPRVIVSKSDDSVWYEYSKAMSYTREVVLFMIKNNLVRLQNCNETFIPYNFDMEGRKKLLQFPNTLTDDEIKDLKPILLNLEKETLYREVKVPDYGTLNEATLIKVLQRLTNEDVVEVE